MRKTPKLNSNYKKNKFFYHFYTGSFVPPVVISTVISRGACLGVQWE